MRIEELHLKNFRCFKELDIQFPKSNLAVFIGLNGAGKSAILDAIISSLFGLVFLDIEYEFENLFSDDDISIESKELNTNIRISYNSLFASWSFVKEKGKIHKIENIVLDGEEIENITDEEEISLLKWKFNHAPIDRIFQYTTKREKKGIETHSLTEDFNSFKWNFISEVDAENRIIIENKDFNCTNPKLNIIRKAVEVFCSNISNMEVSNLRTKDTKGETTIVMDWNGLELSLLQLSEGQRNLLLLIADIAFSLLADYRKFDNPDTVLNLNGIVLIDEIELHLHPQWQREVLPALQKTFPNIQFIVTTHSPQVLSNLKKEEIFILEDNKIVKVTPHVEGRDSNSILYELFGVQERPDHYRGKLNKLYEAIDNQKLDDAKKILAELTQLWGEEDTEIVSANLHLSFAEE